ncbi:MAG: hypothetical protein E6Q97_28080 [Desulfurellales bacterium]|nr:MAG: hypothetical protein E6Q97_28080 [Desulfurellales bacterium]
MRPEFVNYWCGCDPRTSTFCAEARRYLNTQKRDAGQMSLLFDAHIGAAEVCLGLREIKSFQDVPQLPTNHYEIDVEWRHIEDSIQEHIEKDGLDLLPRFQRGHVWTEAQQVAYVANMLHGCEVARTIIFNHSRWDELPVRPPKGTMVIVDGLQRLEAVRKFMRNDLAVFGMKYAEFKGSLRMQYARFRIRITKLATEAAAIRFYLALNAGGTQHTDEEIARVRELLSTVECT